MRIMTDAPPANSATDAVFGGERMVAPEVEGVEKYNRNHDERGRFAESDSDDAQSLPRRPGKFDRPTAEDKKADIFYKVKTPDEVAPTAAEAKDVDGKIHLKRCYERAGTYLVMGPDRPGATLVHGTITIGQDDDGSGGVPIGHGWVEFTRADGSEVVYDGVQSRFYDKASYYRNTKAVEEHDYTADQARRMMLKTKNFGPWEYTAGITSGRVRFADGTPVRGGAA
jgi:hypothetical protein